MSQGTVHSIAGSRGFLDYQLFRQVMRALVTPFDEFVHGGCKGSPDELAERFAREAELTQTIIPAKWQLYGRKAGHMRNPEVVERGRHLVAFWDGASAGTRGALRLAHDAGKPWLIVSPDASLRRGNGFLMPGD